MESTKLKDPNHRGQLAISLALERRWTEAILVNRAVLVTFSNKLEALNLLSKAYLEPSQYKESKETLQNALRQFPHNIIPKKNSDRLNRPDHK